MMVRTAENDMEESVPLVVHVSKSQNFGLGVDRLVKYGLVSDITLVFFVGFFAFFSNPVHVLQLSPLLLLFSITFLGRTSSWRWWQTGLAIFLAWSLSTISYFPIMYLLVPGVMLYLLVLTFAVIVDRIAFRKFIAWMDRTKEQPQQRTTISRRICFAFRSTVCVLFFPLFYSGFYYTVDYFPSPMHAGAFSNLAYATSDVFDLRMLAAVGGIPLVSFSIALAASVVSAYIISYRVQKGGTIEWVRNLGAFDRPTPRKSQIGDGFDLGFDRENFSEFGADRTEFDRSLPVSDSEAVYKTMRTTKFETKPSKPLVEADTKVPYRRMATLFRRSLLPVGVLSIFLLLAGPLISVLFDGTFMWTEFTSLASGLSTVRMGCLPNCLTEKQVAEAQRAGVKLVITSEACGQSFSLAKELAKKYNLAIGLGNYVPTKGLQSRNMFTVVDGKGNTILSHEKFWPVPTLEHLVPVTPRVTTADVPENFFTRSGTVSNMEENKDVISTKDGAENLVVKEKDEAGQKYDIGKERKIKLGAATCFDLYSPNGMAAAGRAGVDLLLVPSLSWTTLHRAHNSVLRMRAVENGFMMFTCTQGGISGVFGPFGETYAQSYETDKLLIYDVPIHPQRRAFSFFRAYPYISRKFGAGIFISSLICGFFGLVLPA